MPEWGPSNVKHNVLKTWNDIGISIWMEPELHAPGINDPRQIGLEVPVAIETKFHEVFVGKFSYVLLD